MNKKNILMLMPCLSSGGAERAAINLAENIYKDYNFYFILFDAGRNAYDFNKDINVINLDIKPSTNIFGKIVNTLKK